MDCRDAYRSLRLRLRHCLLWCRELSMLPRTLVFAGCLGVWCRAFRARIVCMLLRAMVPRARPDGLVVPWCRAVLCVAASHGAAQSYVLPRPMVPRSSTCCRVPWNRAVLRVAAFQGAVQFYLLPRSM